MRVFCSSKTVSLIFCSVLSGRLLIVNLWCHRLTFYYRESDSFPFAHSLNDWYSFPYYFSLSALPLTSHNSRLSVFTMADPSLNTSDSIPNNKRKREGDSVGPDSQRVTRSSNGSNTSIPTADQANFAQSSLHYDAHGLSGADLNIDQQIFQHVGQNGISDDNASALTAKAALAAHNPQQKYPPPPEPSFDSGALGQGTLGHGLPFSAEDIGQNTIDPNHGPNSTAAAVYAAREAQSNLNQKPSVGSVEWHQIRKNNHKEGMKKKKKKKKKGAKSLEPATDSFSL